MRTLTAKNAAGALSRNVPAGGVTSGGRQRRGAAGASSPVPATRLRLAASSAREHSC
jgi:hypothetical protein